jgi:hypothetical protein
MNLSGVIRAVLDGLIVMAMADDPYWFHQLAARDPEMTRLLPGCRESTDESNFAPDPWSAPDVVSAVEAMMAEASEGLVRAS